MKSFYLNNLPSESTQWEILKSVILSGKYEALPKMIEDGYAVSFALLEVLYRLGQEDIIRQICDRAIKFDDTARKFFQIHVGHKVTRTLVNQTEKRRKLHEQRINQQRQEQESQREKQQKEKVKELLENGDKDALFAYVSEYNEWRYLSLLMGEEALYFDLQKYWEEGKYIDDCYAFSEQFLLEHKAFLFIVKHSFRFGCYNVLLPKICNVEGGIDYLYNYAHADVDRWLIGHGYSALFRKSGPRGYQLLAKYMALSKEDYQAWYALAPDETIKHLTKYNKCMLYRVKIASWFRK